MNKHIIWKFFGAFVFLTLIAVFVLNFFVGFKLRDHFEEKISEELRSNALLVGDIITEDLLVGQTGNIRLKIENLARKLDRRITVIGREGKVLADSEKPPTSMESHADRLEIQQALKSGFGQSTRFSQTLGYNMKYVAVRIDSSDKIAGFVRFALPLAQVQLQVRVIYRVVLFGAIVTIIIALTIAYFVSKSITSPIRQMQRAARRIAEGDFKSRAIIKSEDELGQLAKSLNAMADALHKQIADLRKMDTIRTDFVANVSHELKTPLTLIKGYIETLDGSALDDKEKSRRFVRIIKEHADRLENLINDLLSLSELELSPDSLCRTGFDLKILINDIALGFGHALQAGNVTLDINARGDDFNVEADKEKIEQVFVNLIDNGIKYAKDQGRIDISISGDDDAVTVLVEDDGIGIAREHIDRVFERFYRVDKARSRRLGGTGLGLGIAKHIVLAHKGRIQIESTQGRGTKVRVIIPRK
ncbi:MAG: HAMP domain-containing protein [Sedimentisphaerales bacterium]|nr:HAMP domain-containing protein [Sedimentisphaerales bacterium]